MTNPKTKPNVVVFLTDQQRWDTTGVHGNPMRLTPNFDRMATRGTHLAYSFTCQPVCGPARSCLQTGLYATTIGCYKNDIPLPADARTLAHLYTEHGYQTGYIGKWHLASEDPVPQQQRGGYDYWLAANALEMVSDAYETTLYDNDNEEINLPGYRVDAITDAGIRYIDSHKDHPFFLFMSFLEPHHQNHRDDYPAPRGYEHDYRGTWMPSDLQALQGNAHAHLAGYYGMVKRLDEALGRILDTLHSLHLEENTIVLFSSDHGCHFKTRNGEYKRSCHDSSIRVPTAIQGPGFWSGGNREELVSLVDLPPTMLDACGIDVSKDMQGLSIMPILKTDSKNWQDDVFIQISESQIGRAIRTHRWKYSVSAPDKNGHSDSGSDVYQEEFLYDLFSDPYELINLVGYESHREVADYMKERLLIRMESIGEGRPQILNAPIRGSGQRKVERYEVYQ